MLAMAKGSQRICENKIMARPSAKTVSPSRRVRPVTPQRRLQRSLTIPPSARAKRFIVPKLPATIPAIVRLRWKLSVKYRAATLSIVSSAPNEEKHISTASAQTQAIAARLDERAGGS